KLATEVDRDMVESIRKVFEEKLNKEVLFNVVVDPSIIGGVVVEIGGYVFDGSIMKSLEQLREKMIEG
ncbi:MAG: F0F1 ATP synthase subunit delta, partial [Thermosulfidibacteraceae bacterium]